MSIITKVADGFKNIIKNIGTSKDPRETTYFQRGIVFSYQMANDLYAWNWLAAKSVDIPIDDALRKGRSIQVQNADTKKTIEDTLSFFGVSDKIALAAKWARVYGGSAIVVIIDGEDPATPLNVEAIRPSSLRNFIVLDRYNIVPNVVNNSILDVNFGNPEYYTVSREGQLIHHTRVLKFYGLVPTLRSKEENNYWGLPIFTKIYDPIKDYQIVMQAIASLVYESNVDVYRIEGLHKLVAEGSDSLVTKRLQVANEMKSILNAIVLDKNDEYEKKVNQFTHLSSIAQDYIKNVSGASDIPLTRLLGTSPDGMNATGESDTGNYYDMLQSIQNDLTPKFDYLDAIVCASEFPSQDKFTFEFRPLKQLSEVEKNTVELQRAQRDQTYLDNGVITAIDVMAQLASDKTYGTITPERVEEAKKEQELLNYGE